MLLITYNKIKVEGFVPKGDLLAYMFTIAKNNWKNMATKAKRTNALDESEKELSSTDIGVLNTLVVKEKSKAIMDILDTLGDQCSELLRLRIYENLNLEEIAQKMNFSNTDVVKTTIYRCKNKLKNKISKNKGFQNLVGISV